MTVPPRICVAGGTYCTVLRRVGERVIVISPSKRQFSLRQECTCVVGECRGWRVSGANGDLPSGPAAAFGVG